MTGDIIIWSDEYLVGNEAIDTQHKGLVKITNDFYNGVRMGGLMAKMFFIRTIQETVQYVKTHFSTEEDLMQKGKYPFLEEHRKQHEEFVAEVSRQARIIESEDNPDPMCFVLFLMNWILEHIAESDKKITPYIADLR